MTSYKVEEGDTLERVSTIAYGTGAHAELIRVANPELAGGLSPGMVLVIPAIPSGASAVPEVARTDSNVVTVRIGGETFEFWNEIQIESAMDSFGLFSLTAPFEAAEPRFREVFRPFQFKSVEIQIGGGLWFSGTMMTPKPLVGSDSATVTAEGYARAGVLNDCPLPGARQPVEYNDLNLKEIATRQAAPFGLTPVFDAPAGRAFESVTIQDGQSVLSFWRTLAEQRGLVIGNDAAGSPLFQTETEAPAVQRLELGAPGVMGVSPSFDAQAYYSHVTVVTPTFLNVIEGIRHTKVNPFLRGISRPLTFSVEFVEPGEEVALVNTKMGRMFANAISYHVDVASWRNAAGDLWLPNTYVELLAPRAMVYEPTKFLVRRVSLKKDAKKEVASLTCVLPGSFSGQIPEALPWDE
jgi:prophage tail gpP-like protein